MSAIDLGGHSGCKILLFESDKGNWVRKISSNLDYNQRLAKQCEKQAAFPNSTIRTPRVLDSGYTEDGLFYFDMEYIQGVTLAEYIKRIEIGKIRNLVNLIVDGLIRTSVAQDNIPVDASVFTQKIADLKKKLGNRESITIQKALAKLEAHDWSRFTPSVCHGDLTLENIIIKDDEIYLIDFLDSFYDSWVMDIGTLLQDVQVMWSYRFQESVSMNTILRLIVFRDLLLEKVEAQAANYGVEIYYALLQKLVRIFPYTKDQLTYDFLIEKTEMVMGMIEKQEGHV